MKSHIELDVWIKSRKLVGDIYAITSNYPKSELYGLVNQIRRCAISIPSNIAEGCGKRTAKDTLKFLYISRGSLYELETQLYLSFDLKYISENELNALLGQVNVCRKLLSGFINYYGKL